MQDAGDATDDEGDNDELEGEGEGGGEGEGVEGEDGTEPLLSGQQVVVSTYALNFLYLSLFFNFLVLISVFFCCQFFFTFFVMCQDRFYFVIIMFFFFCNVPHMTVHFA